MLTPILITLWVITSIVVILTVPTLKESHKTHFSLWAIFYITLFIDLLAGWVFVGYLAILVVLLVKYLRSRKVYKNFTATVVLSGDDNLDKGRLQTHYISWLEAAKNAKTLPKEVGEYIIENDPAVSQKLISYGVEAQNMYATLLLAENKYTQPHLLTLIATQMLFNYDEEVAYALVKNPSTSPKALAIVAQQQILNPLIMSEIVKNPHTTEATLKYIVGNADETFNLINDTSIYTPVVEQAIERLKLTNPDMKDIDNRWIIASYSQTF